MNNMTDPEIIQALGGITTVARMLGIKPPSVHKWIEHGIPETRLVEMAGQLEIKTGGRFTRKQRWPEKYAIFWPELRDDQSCQVKEDRAL